MKEKICYIVETYECNPDSKDSTIAAKKPIIEKFDSKERAYQYAFSNDGTRPFTKAVKLYRANLDGETSWVQILAESRLKKGKLVDIITHQD